MASSCMTLTSSFTETCSSLVTKFFLGEGSCTHARARTVIQCRTRRLAEWPRLDSQKGQGLFSSPPRRLTGPPSLLSRGYKEFF